MPKIIEFLTTFSKYVSTKLIGEGGAGYVYEATNDNEQKYAVKLLKKHGITSRKRRRFKNELNFCLQEKHKNIISVIDHGVILDEEKAVPFYVMPFYDSSLRTLIVDGLNPNEVIPIFSKLLDGVEAAHLKNIVHRDIKPENVLCNTTASELVVADFGIAHFTEDELYTAVETTAQERLANFQYAAPEQRVRGGEIDKRTDIYALGLILNEMYTKEIPQGTGYKTVASISRDYEYIDEIVEKMIRQNKDERYNSIGEIKKFLKVKGEGFIVEQKLSKLKNTVIPKSEVDDRLVNNPIKIENFEWDDNNLTLILNQEVNPKWIDALNNMGSYQSLMGRDPEAFEFRGNLAVVPSREHEIQTIINYFKSWIPKATTKYEQNIKDDNRYKEEEERKKIRLAIEKEETKARLRNDIKL